MAFTIGALAAKDGGGNAIPGGLVAADTVGGDAGPWFLFNGIVDGVAGSNKAEVDASNRLKVLASIASGGVASGAFASGAFAAGSISAGAVAAGASSFVKQEDAASADADAGVAMMAVRKATPANTSGSDGDYEMLQMSAGRLWVSAALDASAVASGAFAVGSIAAGAVAAGAASFVKTEDSASADGDAGVAIMAVRKATPANTSGTDGDYEPVQMSAGRIWTNTLLGDGVNAVAVKAASTAPAESDPALVVAISPVGEVAHDEVDSGNGSKIAAKAKAGLSGVTLVASNDRSDLFSGVDGVLIVRPHAPLEDLVSGVAAITDGSPTSVIASQGAGIKTYITSAIIANSSATAVTVDLRDGAAGTVKATLPVPANTSGVVCNLPVPLGFSAATAVCADPSSAASTVTVTLVGFKSKV